MCGIAGIINFKGDGVSGQVLSAMAARMGHRGPDDCGIFHERGVGLAFVRLAIIDLSPAGHQPMTSPDGRHVLIYNGELFNYLELREELHALGHCFRTGTDTEVVLTALIQWGEEALHRFNGMWALALYDRLKRETLLVRDRYGIKPLYYSISEASFTFASEIPPLLGVTGQRIEPDREAIHDYLAYNRTDHLDRTFFSNILRLPQGHLLRLTEDRAIEQYKWYDLSERLQEPVSSPEEYAELLSSSIHLRLRSDVPVGVCLSGGLDSSSIVSVLSETLKKSEIRTFSAIYGADERGDESTYIKEFRGRIAHMHFIRPSGASLVRDYEHFTDVHFEPTGSTSVYAQYKLMELAKQHVKVTLDGQGADEQLAGYHYFFGIYFGELLRTRRLLLLLNELIAYSRRGLASTALKTFGFSVLPRRLGLLATQRRNNIIHPDLHKDGESQRATIVEELYGAHTLQDALLMHFQHKLEHLLKYEDRNSMAFSVEARVPFLDHRLVERTLSLDSQRIINQGRTKYILREAMKDLVPERIRTRSDKIGFQTPEGKWFRNGLFAEEIANIVNRGRVVSEKLVQPEPFRAAYELHRDGKVDASRALWKVLQLETWLEKYH